MDDHGSRTESRRWNERQLSPPSGTYAFLNHSSDTLPNNLPPNVDDKPLARQRRRRTSPEDQAILEAAYTKDPKPDKAARLELVKQVALGEKELQIWFQNRRQCSRRKSRPLLPHEIAQYQRSRGRLSSGPLSSEGAAEAFEGTDVRNSTEVAREVGGRDLGDVRQSAPDHLPNGDRAHTHMVGPEDSHPPNLPELLWRSHEAHLMRQSAVPADQAPSAYSDETTHASDHLMSRRSEPSLRREPFPHDRPSAPFTDGQSVPNKRLKRASSMVRISMTAEGKAEVVTKDTISPSPPRLQQSNHPATSIGGSGELGPNGLDKAPSGPAVRSMHRSSSGRSRDSRAWEFWCDKDARGELEEKAEKDGSGSAADAIGLLRSTSGRRILGSIPSKRNSTLGRQLLSLKRSKLDPEVPIFHRSSTTLGRLQSKSLNSAKSLSTTVPKVKQIDSSTSVYIPGNDSDKENWSPGTEPSSDGLSESNPSYSFSNSQSQVIERSAKDSTEFANRTIHADSFEKVRNPEADPELAAFMQGAQRRSNTAEEDLDCVQGLLSLSQGHWRPG